VTSRASSSRALLFVGGIIVSFTGCLVHIADLAPAASDGGPDAGVSEVAPPERDVASPAYRDAVIADAPIAYWRFGETSGAVALDESGHGNHAAYSGNCVFGAPGAIAADPNSAVGFDGTVAGVSALGSGFDFGGRKPFSIEGWVKPLRIEPTVRYFVSREWSSPAGRQNVGLSLLDPVGLTFERHVDDVSTSVSSSAPKLGAFTHVVATYDGDELVLYRDGIAAGRAPDAREARAADVILFLGGKDFEGVLDEVAVYDKALSADRVKAHHDLGVGR